LRVRDMIEVSKIALLIIGIAMVGGIVYLTSGNRLFCIGCGGFGSLSLDQVVMNGQNQWLITATHHGLGDTYNATKTGAMQYQLSISESDYQTYCKYTKGAYWQDALGVFGPVTIQRFAPDPDTEVKTKYGATKVFCSAWALLNDYTCYYFKPVAKLYYVDQSDKEQFSSEIKTTYNGETASVQLNNGATSGSLLLPNGTNVGSVNVMGGLLSLKGTCDTVSGGTYWSDNLAGTMTFASPRITPASSAFKQCYDVQAFKAGPELDGCYNSLSSISGGTNDITTVHPLNGSFVSQAEFDYTPPGAIVNVVYSMVLNADYVTISRPAGVPKLQSASFVKTDLNSGDKATLNYQICNTGSGNPVQFDLGLDCGDNFAPLTSSTPYVEAGNCISSSAQVTASCNGQDKVTASCTLIARGLTPVNGAIPNSSIKGIAVTCTPSVGKCLGDDNGRFCKDGNVQQCSTNSSYGYSIYRQCVGGCITNQYGTVVCKEEAGNSTCGNKVCDTGETVQSCPADCSGGGGIPMWLIIVIIAVIAIALIVAYNLLKNK